MDNEIVVAVSAILKHEPTEWTLFYPIEKFRRAVNAALDALVANEFLIAKYTHFFENVDRPDLSFERSYQAFGNPERCKFQYVFFHSARAARDPQYRRLFEGVLFDGKLRSVQYKLLPAGIAAINDLNRGIFTIDTFATTHLIGQSKRGILSEFEIVSSPIAGSKPPTVIIDDLSETALEKLRNIAPSATPVNSVPKPASLSPPDESAGRWVPLSEAKEIRNLEEKSLETYRGAGQKAADGLSGIDSKGYHWRRPRPKAATEYFIPHRD